MGLELSAASVFVAGHRGLLGSACLRSLRASGVSKILVRTRSELDLTDRLAVDHFFEQNQVDIVFLCAGMTGGIRANQRFPADFLFQNQIIQLNVFSAAHRYEVGRLFFFGSSCMYPAMATQPMAEAALLTGHPEPTSLSYAIAKLAGLQSCLALNAQYGSQRFLPVIPNSVYGPNDNFDLETGHVLSALIARFHRAKNENLPVITFWGSGSPRREFVHADDVASACIHLLGADAQKLKWPINIGTGEDYSIAELAMLVAEVVGYQGSIQWDTAMPDGASRKLLDSTRLWQTGWKPRISLRAGIEATYRWYATLPKKDVSNG